MVITRQRVSNVRAYQVALWEVYDPVPTSKRESGHPRYDMNLTITYFNLSVDLQYWNTSLTPSSPKHQQFCFLRSFPFTLVLRFMVWTCARPCTRVMHQNDQA